MAVGLLFSHGVALEVVGRVEAAVALVRVGAEVTCPSRMTSLPVGRVPSLRVAAAGRLGGLVLAIAAGALAVAGDADAALERVVGEALRLGSVEEMGRATPARPGAPAVGVADDGLVATVVAETAGIDPPRAGGLEPGTSLRVTATALLSAASVSRRPPMICASVGSGRTEARGISVRVTEVMRSGEMP